MSACGRNELEAAVIRLQHEVAEQKRLADKCRAAVQPEVSGMDRP